MLCIKGESNPRRVEAYTLLEILSERQQL
uniref:Uncharacterized protein n=1 Tax=Moniliophthora roreri TaxID=221103 RepID=A0A0W0FRI3_MONRR